MRLYSEKGTTLKTGDGSAKKFLKICKVSFGLCAEAFLPFLTCCAAHNGVKVKILWSANDVLAGDPLEIRR